MTHDLTRFELCHPCHSIHWASRLSGRLACLVDTLQELRERCAGHAQRDHDRMLVQTVPFQTVDLEPVEQRRVLEHVAQRPPVGRHKGGFALPCFAIDVEPADAAQSQVAPERLAGSASVTVAPTTALGPALATTMV